MYVWAPAALEQRGLEQENSPETEHTLRQVSFTVDKKIQSDDNEGCLPKQLKRNIKQKRSNAEKLEQK